MNTTKKRVRVLYSFPHKIGADRICHTAWQQVKGLADAGAEVLVFPGAIQRPLPHDVKVRPTLACGKLRIPYKVLGTLRACELHDYIVSRRLVRMAGQIDIVHAWPLGALRTLDVAKKMGIPTVLERPNAHTRFAYETVQKECDRLGVALPPDHEHAYKGNVLDIEEKEYSLADRLLCPSEFTKRTFLDYGFRLEQLVRHIYGYDHKVYNPGNGERTNHAFTMLFVGVCAVRKGVHFALEAWLKSPACQDGKFVIAGEFLPAYAAKLAPMLSHPSVEVLGHRNDVPDLMRRSDILVLPSIEEGFGLVCTEAMGSGCVPLVSEACTDLCRHMKNAMVHKIGDVGSLSEQIAMLYQDRTLLQRLRMAGLSDSKTITWENAGEILVDIYRNLIEARALSTGSLQQTA